MTALTLAMASGCNNQGEGERCDPLDGNDDCSSGLVCTTTSVYGGSSTGSNATNVCCPANNAPSTAFGCNNSSGGAGSDTFDAGPDADAANVDSAVVSPEDSGPTTDAPVLDATPDATLDASPAPVDAGLDATDAPLDSTAD